MAGQLSSGGGLAERRVCVVAGEVGGFVRGVGAASIIGGRLRAGVVGVCKRGAVCVKSKKGRVEKGMVLPQTVMVLRQTVKGLR